MEIILELWNHQSPNNRADRLDSEQNTNPITRVLIFDRLRIQYQAHRAMDHLLDHWCPKSLSGNRSVRIGPHKHKGSPTEELNQTNRPENGWRLFQQFQDICLLLLLRVNLMILRVFFRWNLLNRKSRIKDTRHQDQRSDIK